MTKTILEVKMLQGGEVRRAMAIYLDQEVSNP